MMSSIARLLSAVAVGMVSLLSLMAQDSDTIRIHYSQRGVEYGAVHRTLATVALPALPQPATIELQLTYGEHTGQLLHSIEALTSDSLALRDLDDYRGRIPYTTRRMYAHGDRLRIEVPAGQHYLYIVANVADHASTSQPTPLSLPSLRAQVHTIVIDGQPYTPLSASPEVDHTSRQLFGLYKPLYVPGDAGSKHYRIPALLQTRAGTLIAIADRRKNDQWDLPSDIDVVLRRSLDGGRTWCEQQTIAQGKGRGLGFGDAAIVETTTGRLVMTFVGGIGMWDSTPTQPIRTYTVYSDDDGVTWSVPHDITDAIMGPHHRQPTMRQYRGSFCASGQGLCTHSGRIMFVAALRQPGDHFTLDNYVIYSDDNGHTWQVSAMAYSGGDESKVIELPDHTLLMSIRDPKRKERIFCTSHDDGATWQISHDYTGLHDPACNGAPLLLQQHDGSHRLIHSLPSRHGERKDGAIYSYDPSTRRWSLPRVINPGWSAYSDMVQLADGDIGYFVEEDEPMSLIYIKVPASLIP